MFLRGLITTPSEECENKYCDDIVYLVKISKTDAIGINKAKIYTGIEFPIPIVTDDLME